MNEPESFRPISRPSDEEYSVSGLAYSRLIPAGVNILQLLYDNFFFLKELLLGCTDEQLLFDQDNYVFYSNANQRTLLNIFDEYVAVRMATLRLFNNLPEDALLRKGYADHSRVSVRALVYHIAGHELHHLEILEGRYDIAPPSGDQ